MTDPIPTDPISEPPAVTGAPSPPPAPAEAAIDAASPKAAEPAPATPKPPPVVVSSMPATPPPPPPPPVTPPKPAAPAAKAPPPRSVVPVLTAIGFVLLFAAFGWLWNRQQELEARVAAFASPTPAAISAAPSVEPARVASLEQQMAGLAKKIEELTGQPAPSASVLQQATSGEAAPPPAPPPTDNSEMLAAQSRLAGEIAALGQRLKDAEARQAELAGKSAVAAQIGALEQRVKDDEQRQIAVAAKDALAQRLQLAALALDAGEPLGDMPGAPAALARYAHSKPPTEAALRLSFPNVAMAAAAASRPSTAGKSLGERILMHASALVTVKEGDLVVVGAPATTVLGIAQEKLDAGDLAGAVAALDGLDGGAAQAIAPWRGEAQALLDARASLANMARS
jgi:hypothetical protein